jgi:hypothetical protein
VEIFRQWEKLWPLTDKDHPQPAYCTRAQTLDQEVVAGTDAAVRSGIRSFEQSARDTRPDVPSSSITVSVRNPARGFDQLRRNDHQIIRHRFLGRPFRHDLDAGISVRLTRHPGQGNV